MHILDFLIGSYLNIAPLPLLSQFHSTLRPTKRSYQLRTSSVYVYSTSQRGQKCRMSDELTSDGLFPLPPEDHKVIEYISNFFHLQVLARKCYILDFLGRPSMMHSETFRRDLVTVREPLPKDQSQCHSIIPGMIPQGPDHHGRMIRVTLT